MNNEEWKDIKNYEGLYQVSNYGRVKSLKRTVSTTGSYGGYKTINMCIRKSRIGRDGYRYLNLCKNGVMKTYKIHKLVANAFLGKVEDGYVVNHKDGNKQNNNLNNLEYCTYSENSKHAYNLGLSKSWNKGIYGVMNKNTRSIDQYALDGHFIKHWDCISDIQRELQIPVSNIIRVCKGSRNSTGGYIWRYSDKGGGVNNG